MCKKVKANVLFVGDDWYDTDKWNDIDAELAKCSIKVVYFPYTKGVSTTKIKETLRSTRGELF
jgi:glycerol-3-phosphate cytidylyltransferase-like family protein